MTAFENAKKFFTACEVPEGWEGCNSMLPREQLSGHRVNRWQRSTRFKLIVTGWQALEKLPHRGRHTTWMQQPMMKRVTRQFSLLLTTHGIQEKAALSLRRTKKHTATMFMY